MPLSFENMVDNLEITEIRRFQNLNDLTCLLNECPTNKTSKKGFEKI